MAPKKKKGGKKLANMTEEERILYLEQKALAEEEMRKKKEEMLMLFLKEKLSDEEKSSRLNLFKLNRRWMGILRDAKSDELKQDIEVLSQTFERVLDRKNNIIQSLSKDADEADEQYNMALRSHLHNVDELVDHHRRRIHALEEDYQQNLLIVRTEFEHERELISNYHAQELDRLHDIMFAMDQNNDERENEARQEFQSLRDEVKNKNLEEKHALRIQLEVAVESLWKQFQNALKVYNEHTWDRKMAFESLKMKDERSAAEIDMQMKKLQSIHERMSQLRGKMQQNARECEGRNRRMRNEKEIIQMRYQWLKSELNELSDRQREKLTLMTVHSNAAMKKLKNVLSKGDRILRLAEICRKRETEEEKVLPFYANTLSYEEMENIEVASMEPASEPLAALMHDYTSLENFWKRYNKVLLDELALEKEKSLLTQENQQLRNILKQYLDGISVNDEVLSTLNPLFVVNQKTNVKLPVPVIDPRVNRPVTRNVIELKQVVKHLQE